MRLQHRDGILTAALCFSALGLIVTACGGDSSSSGPTTPGAGNTAGGGSGNTGNTGNTAGGGYGNTGNTGGGGTGNVGGGGYGNTGGGGTGSTGGTACTPSGNVANGGVTPTDIVEDATLALATVTDSTPTPDTTKVCDNHGGKFAVRTRIDVTTDGSAIGLGGISIAPITDPGRGLIVTDMLIEAGDPVNGEFTGKVRVCGVRLPAFSASMTSEAFVTVFPDKIATAPTAQQCGPFPTFPVTGRYNCGTSITDKTQVYAGCLLELDPTWGVLGLNTVKGAAITPSNWPADVTKTDPTDWYDAESDGKPGITVNQLQGGTYSFFKADGTTATYSINWPPLESNPAPGNITPRAINLQIAFGSTLGGKGKIGADCNSGIGAASAKDMLSRAVGCTVAPGTGTALSPGGGPPKTDNQPCAATQLQFIDLNLPKYQVLNQGDSGTKPEHTVRGPSTGPIAASMRLPATATCDDVLTATFPAFPTAYTAP